MKRLIVFASGAKSGGGSGFQNLVEGSRTGILNARIVAVVSNYAEGGVRERAEKLGVPFVHFSGPWRAEKYKKIVQEHNAEWVALSGWLKLVRGLDPTRTINIHTGPLPRFGGKNMYGHHVHEAVMGAYRRGELTHSAVSMHFVTGEYDTGPIIFLYPVTIREDDTADTLAQRVRAVEYSFQPWITNLVVQGEIRWDGKSPSTRIVPSWYHFHEPLR